MQKISREIARFEFFWLNSTQPLNLDVPVPEGTGTNIAAQKNQLVVAYKLLSITQIRKNFIANLPC